MGSISKSRARRHRPRSTVIISPESVVDLSKSILLPKLCSAMVPSDPGSKSGAFTPCGQTLNCWKAFSKHQLRHSMARKAYNGGIQYVCQLSGGCNAKLHNSFFSLKTHMEKHHMKHSPLPCPFRTCVFTSSGKEEQFTTFSRDRELVQHLEDQHGDLIGQAVDLHATVLLPRWDPIPPPKSIIRPPPLPPLNIPAPGSLFVQPVIVRPTPHLAQLISGEITMPAAHTFNIKPTSRRRQLQSSQAVIEESSSPNPNSDSNRSLYNLADLPQIEYTYADGQIVPGILGLPQFVVQAIPQQKDLVRPLPQPSWTLMDTHPPPTSIFYDALREQVFAQYAEGEGAASDTTDDP
ncbi:hypothetical protein K438DRAFT_1189314 [Mycena galopus ATCC 62051]|nr:hypothetical protein K438DRAFT_1189314 [Mycena galopus ATCC 62051]